MPTGCLTAGTTAKESVVHSRLNGELGLRDFAYESTSAAIRVLDVLGGFNPEAERGGIDVSPYSLPNATRGTRRDPFGPPGPPTSRLERRLGREPGASSPSPGTAVLQRGAQIPYPRGGKAVQMAEATQASTVLSGILCSGTRDSILTGRRDHCRRRPESGPHSACRPGTAAASGIKRPPDRGGVRRPPDG
jgi:hypothetical protein